MDRYVSHSNEIKWKVDAHFGICDISYKIIVHTVCILLLALARFVLHLLIGKLWQQCCARRQCYSAVPGKPSWASQPSFLSIWEICTGKSAVMLCDRVAKVACFICESLCDPLLTPAIAEHLRDEFRRCMKSLADHYCICTRKS